MAVPDSSTANDREDLEVLWKTHDRLFCRLRRGDNSHPRYAFVSIPQAEGDPSLLETLTHEYRLKDYLDSAWALLPLALEQDQEQTRLIVEYAGGEPLDRLIGQPMELGRFFRLAIALTTALGQLHARGLIHKDVKPANAIADPATGRVWLTGFGIASRLPRERQALDPPEFIAGTLAYMAPEQTGRMNRSIDSRSDLYALGVTFYQMLTGTLPFIAAEPMEWVHCHIARQAQPPGERRDMPAVLSGIVMKLLAKTAEDRYQTAAGLGWDLQRCLDLYQSVGTVDDFPLGMQDIPDLLRIPEKLYGRSDEVATLLAAFDRVVANGTREIVLVRGYSGVGKSSVVNELHKAIVPPRGLFASGKFEQYRRDIPYATLAQAFQTLVDQLLAKTESELAPWRQALAEALGGNGELMARMVPELRHLIGEQPAVPELSPQESQGRFQRVFRQFLGVFARQEHPLILFLDDLQWLDAATLTLLTDVATSSEVRHILIVGAYRDNEVDRTHPLLSCMEDIRRAGVAIEEVVLGPLAPHDVGSLIADSLHCDADRAFDLTQLVCEKTAGNPFFVIQFLRALEEEHLLAYDACSTTWVADLDRIEAKGYTDNVVELVTDKLGRLAADTVGVLKKFACLGNIAGLSALCRITGKSLDDIHASLWHAVRDGLIFQSEKSYAFVHDRVQEAAYSLIPPDQLAAIHLNIGRALRTRMTNDELIDAVEQMNYGIELISDPDERVQVAEMNLSAGLKAKASAAYASAVKYLSAGMVLLGSDAWSRSYDLASVLWLQRAECEFMNGGRDRAEALISEVLTHSRSDFDKAAAFRLKTNFHVMRSENTMAVESARSCLALLGIDLPAFPSNKQVDAEIERVWRNMNGRPIEALASLRRVTDLRLEAAMGMLSDLYAPALYHDRNFLHLCLCHMVNMTLEQGLTDASTTGFSWFGVLLGARFDRFQDGYRFAKVARDLVEGLNLVAYKPRVHFAMELIALWAQPPSTAIEHARATHLAGLEGGDISMACYGCNHLVTDLLLRGDRLDEVWKEAERGLKFVRSARFIASQTVIVTQQRFIAYMRGSSANFPNTVDSDLDETAFEAGVANEPIPLVACWYWIMKMQARYHSGHYLAALEAGRKAEPLLWSTEMHIQVLDYYFFRGLAIAAAWEQLPENERRKEGKRLARHLRRFSAWVDDGGIIFRDRSALLRAEHARIRHRPLDAERLYEEAIRLSREHRLIQNEALASELAGRFYLLRGFREIGALYLRKARDCYLRWGADGKVQDLDRRYPHLKIDKALSEPTGTIHAPVEHLDLGTVIKVSEAVSGEIVLDKLIDTLMRMAIEHAGAQRGLLILSRGDEYWIEAEINSATTAMEVDFRRERVSPADLPESVLRYVVRTKESIVLQDASVPSAFSADEYLREHQARSILCLPLLRQSRLLGVFYLENRLTAHAFTPTRMSILKLLASEAASSIENAHLYQDLAEREARIRRLVDANIIGILIFDVDGRVLDANDAFLKIVGHTRADVVSQNILWTEMTPTEWREVDQQKLIPELMMTGSLQPFEKEFFRKDGTRVPVLIGVASFENGGGQGVAFVLDLTERRRASEALHALQTDLEHANRLATMGQLVASIAHEVGQPIGAARNNAHAALRFLTNDPPDPIEVREALECIVSDTYRAGEIVKRIRDQVKKSPPRKERIAIDQAIDEVLALVRGELVKNGVSVHKRLAKGVPDIHADRVQLQQVMLNLIINAIESMTGTGTGFRELTLSSERTSSHEVRVTVSDTGSGISSQHIDRIFDSFYTTKANGVGIGLSICRSIIEAHGGRLIADRKYPQGAVLSFFLPIQN